MALFVPPIAFHYAGTLSWGHDKMRSIPRSEPKPWNYLQNRCKTMKYKRSSSNFSSLEEKVARSFPLVACFVLDQSLKGWERRENALGNPAFSNSSVRCRISMKIQSSWKEAAYEHLRSSRRMHDGLKKIPCQIKIDWYKRCRKALFRNYRIRVKI